MRALTLTPPWTGLIAAGVKRVENRPRSMGAQRMVGDQIAVHAGRAVDESVYERITEIAPELLQIATNIDGQRDRFYTYAGTGDWYKLSRVTSAVIAVATIDRVVTSWPDGTPAVMDGDAPFAAEQRRWFFGPVGILLRDVIALPRPVPCKGMLGFWTLPEPIAVEVMDQVVNRG